MRVIKFRWLHKKSNKIASWETMLKECDRLSMLLPCEDWIPMQYTGLLDKQGKEIYEGDIVREAHGPTGAAIGTVENINGDTVVKFLPGTIPDDWNHEYYPVFGKMDHAEVIGNIYENPDLLKESQHDQS